jgi:hypothetical protein
MKRLAAFLVVLAALSLCAQTYGYVLVYNLFGMVEAVDTLAEDRDVKFVNGFIVMEFNEAEGIAEESCLVLFGREDRNRLYSAYDNPVNLAVYGNYVTSIIEAGAGNTIVMTGRMRARNVGNPQRENAATILNGAMTLQWGELFDLEESLVGAGSMQATLNDWLTRNANSTGAEVGDMVYSILETLEARGYEPVEEEDEPLPM